MILGCGSGSCKLFPTNDDARFFLSGLMFLYAKKGRLVRQGSEDKQNVDLSA